MSAYEIWLDRNKQQIHSGRRTRPTRPKGEKQLVMGTSSPRSLNMEQALFVTPPVVDAVENLRSTATDIIHSLQQEGVDLYDPEMDRRNRKILYNALHKYVWYTL